MHFENTCVETFDLDVGHYNNNINLLPTLRYHINFGYVFSNGNEVRLNASVGNVTSQFEVFADVDTPVGKVKFNNLSYQIKSIYSYTYPINSSILIGPTVILTYNKNLYDFAKKEVVETYNNYSNLFLNYRYLAEKDLDFYLSAGTGIQFGFAVSSHVKFRIISSYHFSIIPNYLWAVSGSYDLSSNTKSINTQLILNSGSRINNSISFVYHFNLSK